jgi:autotransporter-associated beta strand protein
MKQCVPTLLTLALASASFAQVTIYWTGNEDRWGGGNLTATGDDNFSTTPGGTIYQKVSNSETYHHVYDQNSMAGANMGVSMNRANNTLASLTLTGIGSGGFTFNINTTGTLLAGPVSATAGTHVFNSSGNSIALTANSAWSVAADAALSWNIPLTGNFGITKSGAGTLVVGATHLYTGDTAINEGAFGVFGASASLAGNLSLASGTKLVFGGANVLTVAGDVTFAGSFGIADVLGLDSSVSPGTYTLISGNVDFTNITDVGAENAFDLGNGISAYFQQSSLQVVVVPEPSVVTLLLGLGALSLVLARRRVVS